MFHGDRTALMAMRMVQAAEFERLDAIRQELKGLQRLLRWRREMKYSPEQPRDANGRWMPWEHGEGEPTSDAGGSEAGDAFGLAPDGTVVDQTGGIPEDKLNWTTQQFISAYCRGGIREVMPGQFLDTPIADVVAQAKNGDAAARRCLKLLDRPEYRK